MIIRGYEIGGRIIAVAIGALILVIAAGLFLRSCQSAKTAKKEAEVAQGQAGAAVDSGAEAMNTVSNVAAADAETDLLVSMGQAEIAAASHGTKGKKAKQVACRLKTYRDTPQCQEVAK